LKYTEKIRIVTVEADIALYKQVFSSIQTNIWLKYCSQASISFIITVN